MKTLVPLSAGGATPFQMLNGNGKAVYYSLTGRPRLSYLNAGFSTKAVNLTTILLDQ